MRNPYEVLGLDQNASYEVVSAKYEELKARYGEQRFREGEEGNEGARLLHEVEVAWAQISQDMQNRNKSTDFGNDLGAVDEYIKSGNLSRAQDILDGMSNRSADWHYYQAMVYYKKGWNSESRAQLSLAVNMEPNNSKYVNALKKMDMVMNNATINAGTIGGENEGPYNNYNRSDYNSQQNYQRNDANNTLSNCCATYCMMELCCASMRCCRM